MSRAVRSVLLLLAASVLGASAAVADDAILYYVKDGNVVFTNTPSKQTKPVPGSGSLKLGLPSTLPDTHYDQFIRKVADEEGLDASLIKAVALVESGFNPRAVSRAGARGLMQLMPATARQYGVKDPHDPYQSLRAGAQHLRKLLVEFEGDISLALAAYNAGSGAVRKYGGIPRYRETQDYVRKVQAKLNGTPRRAPKPAKPPVNDEKLKVEVAPDGTVRLSN
jgi:soluble lytic murein transglycosylase-like protein